MDTSAEYIALCTLAHELQGIWVPLPWDYIFCRVDHTITCIMPDKPVRPLIHHWFDGKLIQGCECCGSKREHIWLPRQDQIQAALLTSSRRVSALLLRVADFSKYKPTASAEQIYARYFMAIKAKKSWVDGEWITSTGSKHGLR